MRFLEGIEKSWYSRYGDEMRYSVYNIKSGRIVFRTSLVHEKKIPKGCSVVCGDYDDVLFNIDHATGEPYPHIEQDQLPWLIRRYRNVLRQKRGVNDIPALLTERELGNITPAQYDAKLAKRRAIDACHDALIKMKPIPQDYNNPEYWKCK